MNSGRTYLLESTFLERNPEAHWLWKTMVSVSLPVNNQSLTVQYHLFTVPFTLIWANSLCYIGCSVAHIRQTQEMHGSKWLYMHYQLLPVYHKANQGNLSGEFSSLSELASDFSTACIDNTKETMFWKCSHVWIHFQLWFSTSSEHIPWYDHRQQMVNPEHIQF